MTFNPRELIIAVRGSFWLIPALVVLACGLLAIAMVEVDARLPADFYAALPRLFGAGAEGSRAMLSAIATSTMTVAGVVFSINIVALSLATAQYSPHVLQSFIRDRTNQAVLGIFLGIYTYCLMVLRTVRGGDESFVPGTSIVVAIALALAGVAFLIFFIHHVSTSIQVSHIIAQIADETRRVIERIYPEGSATAEEASSPDESEDGIEVLQRRPPGYVTHIDYDALATIAGACGGVLRVPVAVGDFLLTGEAIAVLHGAKPRDESWCERVRSAFAIGRTRNIDQDVAFGLQQLVDVASKALSSSSNDTTTALHALEHLTALLSMLASRNLSRGATMCREGRVVLVCARPQFPDFVLIVTRPFRRHARDNPLVLERLVAALRRVGTATVDARDVETIVAHVALIEETVKRAGFESADDIALQGALAGAARALDAQPRHSESQRGR